MINIYIDNDICKILEKFILEANHIEADELDKLKDYVEDPEFLLNILYKTNKKHILKLKNGIKEKCSNSNNDILYFSKYDRDDVIEILEKYRVEDISEKFSKKELSEMFWALYSINPLSSWGKLDIVLEMRKYYNSMDRIKGFKE